MSDGIDPAGFVCESILCFAAYIDDFFIIFEDHLSQPVMPQILQDVFLRIQFRAIWRQIHQCNVLWNFESRRDMSFGAIDNDGSMRALSNPAADRAEMFVHRIRIGKWHNDRFTNIMTQTDCSKYIGIRIPLIAHHPRGCAMHKARSTVYETRRKTSGSICDKTGWLELSAKFMKKLSIHTENY